MDSRLQAYLDGELTIEELPSELHAEAEAWSDLLEDVRRTAPAGAPLGLEARVMSALAGAPSLRRPRWLEWLLSPRPVSVSPAAALAGAALLLAALLGPLALSRAGGGDDRMYVQFVVDSPAAETVHLVGDFNEWQPTVELEDPDGDGVWTGRVALEPGVHQYMFVIDGADWMTDPNASSYQDDGFGQRNAVVAVSPLNGA